MREIIRSIKQQAALQWDEHAKYDKNLRLQVERTEAARRWLDRARRCALCNGKGFYREAIPSPILSISADGYVPCQEIIGDRIYTGWKKYDPADHPPKWKEVFCSHECVPE